jgi:hypothetical protein
MLLRFNIFQTTSDIGQYGLYYRIEIIFILNFFQLRNKIIKFTNELPFRYRLESAKENFEFWRTSKLVIFF